MTPGQELLLAPARALQPWWAAWLPLLTAALAAAFTLLIGLAARWVAGRDLRRLPPGAHWTERARLVAPVRATLPLVGALSMVTASVLVVPGALSAVPAWGAWVIGLGLPAAACIGLVIATENRLVRPLPLGVRLVSLAAWVVAFLAGLLAGLAVAVETPLLGWPWWATGAALLATLPLSLGGGVRLARLLGLVAPAPERAVRALEAATTRAGARPVPIRLLRVASANAFALPLQQEVLVTDGLLAALDDEGLAAVVAHELGHLSEPRAMTLARTGMVAVIPAALWLAMTAARQGGLGSLAWLAAVALGFIGLLRLYQRLARRLERRADQAGAEAGPAYARALEALYRQNLHPAVQQRAGGHPHLYDRLEAAGCRPVWPRPAPPRRQPWIWLGSVLATVALIVGASALRDSLHGAGPDEGSRLQLWAAAAPCHHAAATLAAWSLSHGEPGAAVTWYGAAEALAPGQPRYPAMRALLLAAERRCAEAVAALRGASGCEGDEDDDASGLLAAARRSVADCAPAAP